MRRTSSLPSARCAAQPRPCRRCRLPAPEPASAGYLLELRAGIRRTAPKHAMRGVSIRGLGFAAEPRSHLPEASRNAI